jgi:DNA-binding SARP family transcriptional activator/transcriptional regulator with XRE-family HTH domain/tetratricopeptide (TPR) repeat protein
MYRQEAGLTQRELAAKTGLSVATLRDFEQSRRRRPRPNSITALADALGLDPGQAAGLARVAVPPRRRPTAMPSPGAPGDGFDFARAAHSSERGAGLWLTALGPLEVSGGGTPLNLGPPARRAVLGLLVMEPGVIVRRDTIVDVLWGDSPPRTAVGLVQAHVSRIRRLLTPYHRLTGNGEAIDSVRGAYRLNLSGPEVDLLVFRDLATRATAARSGGDDVTAVEYYEQAMALWRGEPLADIDVLSGHSGITALRQELNGVLLRYAEVACALGQHAEVLPRLRALAGAEPLNELANARLMVALAGSGQQAAAIRVYEDVQSRLDRELGIFPGEELTDAYLRVLRQDIPAESRMRGAAPPSALPVTVHVAPRQLPAAPRSFTGRAGELAMLSGLANRDRGEAGGMVIAALTGMAGSGKTALAVHFAHQVADQFPDGQLFVNLRGRDRSGAPVTPTEAVRGFLTALGVPPARIPADTDGQAALYRSLLADRRMLVVLDNAQDAEQVRPLLPGSPGCLVLVTSRSRLTGLAVTEDAHLITLGMLTKAESHDLLARDLGAERAMAEPVAVSELIALCGRLPLALRDVAARAVARPGLSLAALTAEMRDERWRLDVLETGESATSVRMVFSWSRAKLGSRASRMFHLLGVHPGPDITGSAAASLAGLPQGQASLALAELCDEHLLNEHVPGRYSCHDLLRSYAAEEAMTRESAADRDAAVQRVLGHYLQAASVASGFLRARHFEVMWTPPRSDVVLDEIGGPAQAAEWFDNEQHVLLAMVSQAAEGGHAPYAWELPWVVGWYFQGKACWLKLAAAQEAALAVATRLRDLTGLTMAQQHLGWLKFLLGDIASAGHHLVEAIELAGRLGDGRLRALAGLSLAYVLQAQDRLLEAMAQARQALRLYRAVGDPRGEARALYAIGWHLVQLGEHQQAVHFSSRALMTYRESVLLAGPRPALSNGWLSAAGGGSADVQPTMHRSRPGRRPLGRHRDRRLVTGASHHEPVLCPRSDLVSGSTQPAIRSHGSRPAK